MDTAGPLKLVVVGEVEVGKTSICGRLLDEFTKHSQATIMPCFHKYKLEIDGRRLDFNIWDTAGAERYRSVNRSFYHNTKAAVIVYDITNRRTWEELQNYWVEEVQNEGHDNMVIAIVGNKCDQEDKRAVAKSAAQDYCKMNNFVFAETSALRDVNVKKVFRDLARRTLEVESLFEKPKGGASVSPRIKPQASTDSSGCAC